MTTIPAQVVHQQMMDEDPAYRAAWEASELPMMIAFALCDARRRANLTRAEVASQIGVSEAVVGRWERGVRVPSLASLRRYADVTGSRLRIDLVDKS
ncbi:helix-turn-helix transcriptional regulator [Methylobacterium sp. P1-11]|uniref:helix-turn-helix domain-containing protein n=1 Tax=Methylobacterium sp. P1-11 TaxID=2024616 RepID=UPI001563B5EB|nr:helix-turn-helix transcriptional regulator [Methylobacterium sp. P1-11]